MQNAKENENLVNQAKENHAEEIRVLLNQKREVSEALKVREDQIVNLKAEIKELKNTNEWN